MNLDGYRHREASAWEARESAPKEPRGADDKTPFERANEAWVKAHNAYTEAARK